MAVHGWMKLVDTLLFPLLDRGSHLWNLENLTMSKLSMQRGLGMRLHIQLGIDWGGRLVY